MPPPFLDRVLCSPAALELLIVKDDFEILIPVSSSRIVGLQV